MDYSGIFGISLLIRGACILYGIWQDSAMAVKYTDIDYQVFTDAAKCVTEGKSPYERATYRYTPILAWILTPNIYVTPLFGKIVFVFFDVMAGYFICAILTLRGCSKQTAQACSYLWLFNPLPIVVSSRGNMESIMVVLVLASIYCICRRNRLVYLGFALFALSVHVKIYPAVYALPMFLLLGENYNGSKPGRSYYYPWTWITKTQLICGLVCASVFLSLTAIGYYCYGQDFVNETYLYHVIRRDIRHNFSVYFYMLYLTGESSWSPLLGLAAFVPQLMLLLTISLKYFQDLPFCCFLQTFIFVTFNKVCTSQYFLWYLCLLPLVLPSLSLHLPDVLWMMALWFGAQALWLCPAYFLEMKGFNSFLLIWLAGLLFFVVNIYIVYKLLIAYKDTPLFLNGKLVPLDNPSFNMLDYLNILQTAKGNAQKLARKPLKNR